MDRIDDKELESLLRRCGEELRLRSEDIATGRRGPDVQKAMRDFSNWQRESPKFWDKVRGWLIPVELALACGLLLLLSYSFYQGSGPNGFGPRPERYARDMAVPRPPMIQEENMLEADETAVPSEEISSAYLALNESLNESWSAYSPESDSQANVENNELETSEQETNENLFPEYVSMSVELPDSNDEEENLYEQEDVFDS